MNGGRSTRALTIIIGSHYGFQRVAVRVGSRETLATPQPRSGSARRSRPPSFASCRLKARWRMDPWFPRRAPAEVRHLRFLIGLLAESAKLLPQRAIVGGPFRHPYAGDPQLVLLQRTVAVRANILDARPPGEQHAPPRTGLHRHAEAAQANAAAAILIEDNGRQNARAQQEPAKEHDVVQKNLGNIA